jgi:hypothetical protein
MKSGRRLAEQGIAVFLLRLQSVNTNLLHPFHHPLLHVSCVLSGRGDLPGMP